MSLSKIKDPDADPDAADKSKWTPNTKFHVEKLQIFCRVCSEPRALSSDRFPISKKAYSNEIEEIWQVNVLADDKTVHPPYICRACIIKMERYSKAKRGVRNVSMPRIKPVHIFTEHTSSGCDICSFTDKIRYSPRKRLYSDEAKNGSTSGETTPKFVKQDLNERFGTRSSSRGKAQSTPMSGVKPMVGSSPSSVITPPSYSLSYQQSTSKLQEGKSTTLELEENNATEALEHSYLEVNGSESIPVEKFAEEHIAREMQCLICFEVPLEPTITPCGHFHCKTCIRHWLETSDSRTNCRSVLSIHDVAEISGFRQAVFEAVHVWCEYKLADCTEKNLIKDIKDHEQICPYKNKPFLPEHLVLRDNSNTDNATPYTNADNDKNLQPKVQKKRGPGLKKKSLFDWSDRSWPRKRIKEIDEQVNQFCLEKNETKLDVLYFLLRDELNKVGQNDKAKRLDNLRKSSETYSLSTEQCLALRTDALLSKGQYRKIYGIFDQNLDDNALKPPSQLDSEDVKYLPGSTSFEVIDTNGDIVLLHEAKTDCKPLNILSEFTQSAAEIQYPNVKGVRYNYAEALANTLLELEPDIEEFFAENKESVNPDQILCTTIKDGGDGLGSVSVYKEKADRFLPDKALRFSFAVISSEGKANDDTSQTVYECENPNSVRVNRPLLECIADENNKASSIVCLLPIELEREYLKDKVIKIKVSEHKWRYHKLRFFNSMVDEKYDRAMSGYMGSGSKRVSVLCDALQQDCKKHLGSFKINRTLQETKILANIMRVNPDNMSASDLAKISKGVKSLPVSYSRPLDKLIDATHADINLAIFFQKVIVRIIADVSQWDATQDVVTLLNNAQHQFDLHMKQVVGVNPQLMMPGNYARVLFDEENSEHILKIISNDKDRENMSEILRKFRFLRKVYRAHHPEKEDVSNYKKAAIEMGSLLIKHFDFAQWPNYLHRVIEHVQEILEDPNGPGSIGAFSGEGNEAGNKLFRLFRKNYATKGDSYRALEDVIRIHWLYSSKKLENMASVTHRKHKCSSCGHFGHNKRSCNRRK